MFDWYFFQYLPGFGCFFCCLVVGDYYQIKNAGVSYGSLIRFITFQIYYHCCPTKVGLKMAVALY
jgi:hypothetical protein